MRKIRIRFGCEFVRRQPVLRMRCCGGKFAVIQYPAWVEKYDPACEEYYEECHIGLRLYEVKSGEVVMAMTSPSMESLLRRFGMMCVDKRKFKDRLRSAVKNYCRIYGSLGR